MKQALLKAAQLLEKLRSMKKATELSQYDKGYNAAIDDVSKHVAQEIEGRGDNG